MTKQLAILGSTGSIGRNTLAVVAAHPDRFAVAALAGGTNVTLLAEQVKQFRPHLVAVRDESAVCELATLVGKSGVEIVWGKAGAAAVASVSGVDLVVSAIVGSAGLASTAAALASGKDVALANKETLVAAGSLITELARKNGATIIPIDSEHSAIHQALAGHRLSDVRRIVLTASGGPFRETPAVQLKRVSVAQALAHPNWSMGKKITIDSATLMNKGLEVIEATWLFALPATKIDVVIHPQSIVHSLVEYCDGAMIAQLGMPDMRTPIAYALAYPERVTSGAPFLDLARVGPLSFEPVDHERFPCLALAGEALARGASMPAVLNAANEAAVAAFLEGKMEFLAIPRIVAETMSRHEPRTLTSVADVLDVDAWARAHARELSERLSHP